MLSNFLQFVAFEKVETVLINQPPFKAQHFNNLRKKKGKDYYCGYSFTGYNHHQPYYLFKSLTPQVAGGPVTVAPRLEGWSTLPSKRTLVAQFVSLERIEEFNKYWETHEVHLMVPTTNASLLLSCPYLDESVVLENIVDRHNWTLVKRVDHPHSLAHGPLFYACRLHRRLA